MWDFVRPGEGPEPWEELHVHYKSCLRSSAAGRLILLCNALVQKRDFSPVSYSWSLESSHC